jgi:hypothetical protein
MSSEELVGTAEEGPYPWFKIFQGTTKETVLHPNCSVYLSMLFMPLK